MKTETGITKKGECAETLLKSITGYSEPQVEVKAVDTGNTGTKAVNQVRPKYGVPLVIFHQSQSQWYVIPPLTLLKLVENKTGQHSASPLETWSFSLGKKHDQFKCDATNLKDTITKCLIPANDLLELQKINKQFAEDVKKYQQNVNDWRAKLIK